MFASVNRSGIEKANKHKIYLQWQIAATILIEVAPKNYKQTKKPKKAGVNNNNNTEAKLCFADTFEKTTKSSSLKGQ